MQTRTKAGELANLEKLTPEKYQVPAGEEHLYHVLQETKKYDADTGQKRTKPRVQKYGKKVFENNVYASQTKRKMSMVILHDPNEWLAKNAEAVKRTQIEREQRAENRKAKEREQLKAELMAEIGNAAPAVDQEKELEIMKLKAQIAQAEQAKAEAEREAAELRLKEQAKAEAVENLNDTNLPEKEENPVKGKTARK